MIETRLLLGLWKTFHCFFQGKKNRASFLYQQPRPRHTQYRVISQLCRGQNSFQNQIYVRHKNNRLFTTLNSLRQNSQHFTLQPHTMATTRRELFILLLNSQLSSRYYRQGCIDRHKNVWKVYLIHIKGSTTNVSPHEFIIDSKRYLDFL